MRYCKPLPSVEYLRDTFEYCESTGVLVRKRNGNTQTTKNSKGYIVVSIKHNIYQATRVIWKLVYGVEPEGFIDHINGDVSDNRLENLRDSTHSHNAVNSLRRLGYQVVKKPKGPNRLRVCLMKNGKRVYDKPHSCPLVARIDYLDAVEEYYGVQIRLLPDKEILGIF